MSDKVSGRKQPSVGPRQAMSREPGTRSSYMSVYKSSAEESVNMKDSKESSIYKSSEEYFKYSCGPKQAMSREPGTRSSDMSVYKSSAEESVNIKGSKESSIYKSSEEYFEYSCDPCKTAGDDAEAEGFCNNCDEYLCSMCFRTHSRNKASKHHTLLDKDAMPRKTVKLCDPCKTVGGKIDAVGYCKDCKDYLCDICYKSHSRNKSSRNHMLVDKTDLAESHERAITYSIAKMNIHKEDACELKCNEEYTYVRDINVKAATDTRDCYITRMTLVSNTELVLVDLHNKSLKFVDTETSTITHVLGLQAEPAGITTISKDQVAVVLYDKDKIQIISTRGGLFVNRTFNVVGNCLDIKFSNGKLFASFFEPVKFQIFQPTGAISKTINPDSEILKHCIAPNNIVVSPDECMIYISDCKTSKVMSMDMDGCMVFMYQGQLESPVDITVSPFGVIYLCNRNQHNVYRMTFDLNEATSILGLGDGLELPQAIAMGFNTENQHTYISSASKAVKYSNFIKVYKLK